MQKVVKAGGTLMGEPMDIPGVVRYVSFTDTEGNRVSLLQPAPMEKPEKQVKAKSATKKQAAAKKKATRKKQP